MLALVTILISAIAILSLLLARRKRARSPKVIGANWSRIAAGFVVIAVGGLLAFCVEIPALMTLFVPEVVGWLLFAAYAAIAFGVLLLGWGLLGMFASVEHIEAQESSEDEWRNFYIYLQDLTQQPFSFVEIVNLSINQLLQRAEADGAAVLLHKENSDEMILAAFSNLSPEMIKRIERREVGGDVIGRVQKLARTQNVANITEADQATRELLTESGFLSTAAFPLRSRSRVAGVVAIFSSKPFHFNPRRQSAITVAVSQIAALLESVRDEKEIKRLKERMRPAEEAKRITDELFFRRGIGGNLELREAIEFERVRKFFDADSIKLVFRDSDNEFRIKASSGGAETGLRLDPRKHPGLNRAIAEKKLLLLSAPKSSPAGHGHDSMPRQTLFIPVPYPDRDDMVLLLESEKASLQFSEEKLSAVRVASVYLADLHFLFMAKRDGDRQRNSVKLLDEAIGEILQIDSNQRSTAKLVEAGAQLLPSARAHIAAVLEQGSTRRVTSIDSVGLRTRQGGLLKQLVQVFDTATPGEAETHSLAEVSLNLDGDLKVQLYQWSQQYEGELVFEYLPLIQDGRLLGLYLLVHSANDQISNESRSLLRRLLDLATLRLAWLARERSEVESGGVAAGSKTNRLDPHGQTEERSAGSAEASPNSSSNSSSAEAGQPREGVERAVTSPRRINPADPHAIWDEVEADLDGSDMAAIRDENLLPIVEELLHQSFSLTTNSKVYLSHFVDDTHLYYLASIDETDWHNFRARNLQGISIGEWRPCPFADELPASFRSLAGEFIYSEDEADSSLRSIVWRLPRVSKKPERERKLNILGIDDQEVIRELLTNIIRRMGHRIVTVASGNEALAELARDPYDIVIAEAELPDLSGWELTRRIKAGNPDVKAIVLSGWEAVPEANSSGGSDADFVLTKPFKMEQLTEMISSACSQIGS